MFLNFRPAMRKWISHNSIRLTNITPGCKIPQFGYELRYFFCPYSFLFSMMNITNRNIGKQRRNRSVAAL